MRGFAMFDQVKVGGAEKYFHGTSPLALLLKKREGTGLPIRLTAMFDATDSHHFGLVVNIIKYPICANSQRITRVTFEFL